jgi:ArsR family transcriptional regulator, arsenate/arsenite/antimonite-responsive transcriptional repressor
MFALYNIDMTYTKATAFDISQQDLARYAKVLSHPARIAIIELLSRKNSCISGDIANELPLSRTTVSQHLQELKSADLIHGQIDGQTVCYCLNTALLKAVREKFMLFFDASLQSFDCDC